MAGNSRLLLDQLGVLLDPINDLAGHCLGLDHVLHFGQLEIVSEQGGDHGYKSQDQGWDKQISLDCREPVVFSIREAVSYRRPSMK